MENSQLDYNALLNNVKAATERYASIIKAYEKALNALEMALNALEMARAFDELAKNAPTDELRQSLTLEADTCLGSALAYICDAHNDNV